MQAIARLQNLFGEIVAVFYSRTGRQTRLVFLGEIVNAALGLLANVFVIRKLSVEEYGLFTLFSSTMLLINGFSHLGWMDTFVRFGSRHKDEPIFGAVTLYFLRQISLSVVSITGGAFLLSRFFVNTVYHRPEFAAYYHWAVVGALLLSLNSFFTNFLRVRQDFQRFFLFQIGMTLARCAGLALLLGFGALVVRNIVGVYLIAPFAVLAVHVALFSWPQTRAAGRGIPKELKADISTYNYWLLVSMITTAMIGNIDSFFLAHYYPDNRQVANFGVATRMTLPINFLITSLTAIVLPKLSNANSRESMSIYRDKLKRMLFPFAVFVLVLGLALVPILKSAAGGQYDDIDFLLQLQIVSLFIVLLVNPIGIMLYAAGRTRLFAYMNLAQLVLDIGLNVLLIPRYGAVGATLATIGVNVLGLACVYTAAYRMERQGAEP